MLMANVRSVFQSTQNLRSVLLLLLLRPFLRVAASRIELCCGTTGNFTVNSAYDENLSSLLSSISSDNSVTYGFYNLSSGEGPDQVNGIALCRGDVALPDCQACINNSRLEIVRGCPVQKEAIIYYDECLLRYSDQPIFGVVDSSKYYYTWNGNSATKVTEFNQVLMGLMDGLRSRAAAGNSTRKFAVGNTNAPDSQTLYGLAQCTPDLSKAQCNDCLAYAIGRIPLLFTGQPGGRLLVPSCNIRFDESLFYDPSADDQVAPASPPAPQPEASPPPASPPLASPPKASPPPASLPPASPPEASPQVSPPNPTTDTTEPPPEGKSSSTSSARTIIIVVVSIVAVCLLLVVSIFCIRRRRATKPIKNYEIANEIITAESLQYDFETVRAATNNFSEENKLGQGGFGSVYKGMLASGQEIAVKRLSRGQGQGDQEFKTEVLLVARLQHRNLVRLLGICLSGDERLLIYEFMPNSSLDRFIFDPVKRQQLDWERRQKIIGGIARGLLYLHEDSQLRIIHRDLKASNILLDAEMTPKISDFGMARLFTMDETHGATSRIVGTYGYMAPEYGLYGQFSVKSDVFSFGVLVLEIVSGQKNNIAQSRDSDSVQDLLSIAWRNWREGTLSNIVDPLLSYMPMNEIQRCIHIGLLCSQENASNRPNMTSVLLMLSSFSISLAVPSQPAFYRHGNMESTGSFLAMDNSRGTGSDESKSKSHHGSVDEDTITDLSPR